MHRNDRPPPSALDYRRLMPQITVHKLGSPRTLSGEGNTWDVIWALQVNGTVHQVMLNITIGRMPVYLFHAICTTTVLRSIGIQIRLVKASLEVGRTEEGMVCFWMCDAQAFNELVPFLKIQESLVD